MDLHYTRNIKWEDGSINYIFLDFGLFRIYDNTNNYDSGSLYSYSLLGSSQQLMGASGFKYSNVEDYITLYTNEEKVDAFWR